MWIRKVFSDPDPQILLGNSDSKATILTRNICINSASHCFHVCSITCTIEQMFSNKNKFFFLSFKYLIFNCSKTFYLLTVGGSESELFSDSDSDPAKTYGFFWNRIHNAAFGGTVPFKFFRN
jgi:hypothetical protein